MSAREPLTFSMLFVIIVIAVTRQAPTSFSLFVSCYCCCRCCDRRLLSLLLVVVVVVIAVVVVVVVAVVARNH